MSVDAESPVPPPVSAEPAQSNGSEAKVEVIAAAAPAAPVNVNVPVPVPLPPAVTTAPDAAPPPLPAPPAVPTIPTKPKVGEDTIFTGELLRQIRESQRITLKEISERTRISVANLSALESERYEDLPNARVYVRGFVRCLAVEIGLDRDHVSRTYVPRWEAWFVDQNSRR